MFKPTSAKSPADYISQIDEPRKAEIVKLDKFIRKTLPKLERKMYHNIIGYGKMQYRTKAGVEGDWFLVGLASQKHYISVYVSGVEDDKYLAEKSKKIFPKASIGKSCIRFKKTEDIDMKELGKLFKKAKKLQRE